MAEVLMEKRNIDQRRDVGNQQHSKTNMYPF